MIDVSVLKVFSSICLVQLHIHLPDEVHLKMKSQSLSIHPNADRKPVVHSQLNISGA